MSLKIVVLSDTHGKHKQINIPTADILIHAGDSTNIGRLSELEDFSDFFCRLPHKNKVIIAGNHDPCFEDAAHLIPSLLPNVHYLLDSSVTIEGIKIYGTPWNPCYWAFHCDEEKLETKWQQIPEDTDILVTHIPPAGILDLEIDSGKRFGCPQLAERIKTVQPKYHVFGHVHHQDILATETTTFINASNCGEIYQFKWQPITFDY